MYVGCGSEMYVNDKVKVSWLSWPTWMNRREWPSHSTLPNGCCVLIIDARQCERYFHFIIMNSWILTTHTRTHAHTHTHTDGTVPLSCCLVLSCTAQGLMCGLSAASLQNFCWGWDLWSFVRRHIATHLVSCLQFTLTILCGIAAVHHTDPFHLPCQTGCLQATTAALPFKVTPSCLHTPILSSLQSALSAPFCWLCLLFVILPVLAQNKRDNACYAANLLM